MNLNRDEIRRAAQRIADKVVRTDTHRIDSTLTLKLEGAQRSGSFKARGAMNAMLCSTIGVDGVVAASGGNHGAAVAWACLLYTSPSPRDATLSRMPSSA